MEVWWKNSELKIGNMELQQVLVKLESEKALVEAKLKKEKDIQATHTNTEKIDLLREIEIQKAALKDLEQSEKEAKTLLKKMNENYQTKKNMKDWKIWKNENY